MTEEQLEALENWFQALIDERLRSDVSVEVDGLKDAVRVVFGMEPFTAAGDDLQYERDNPYKCAWCGTRFADRGKWKEHSKVCWGS